MHAVGSLYVSIFVEHGYGLFRKCRPFIRPVTLKINQFSKLICKDGFHHLGLLTIRRGGCQSHPSLKIKFTH